MKTFSTLDPAKGLANVAIRLFQVFTVLIFCLSVYSMYLSYLGLLPEWHFSNHFDSHNFLLSGDSKTWQMIFFVMPALTSIIAFFLLGYLGKVIREE